MDLSSLSWVGFEKLEGRKEGSYEIRGACLYTSTDGNPGMLKGGIG